MWHNTARTPLLCRNQSLGRREECQTCIPRPVARSVLRRLGRHLLHNILSVPCFIPWDCLDAVLIASYGLNPHLLGFYRYVPVLSASASPGPLSFVRTGQNPETRREKPGPIVEHRLWGVADCVGEGAASPYLYLYEVFLGRMPS